MTGVLKRTAPLLSPTMDPELWSNLPSTILLEIYKMLPLQDFYKLRVVCKDWNRVACERRCFSDPIPKPYFVLINQGKAKCPIGTLAYNILPGRWIWSLYSPSKFPHPVGDLYEPFTVEGILFDGSCLWVRPGSSDPALQILHDLHAGEDVLIAVVPRIAGYSTLGMTVDTSKRPYAFKLIMGSCSAGTLILDSQTKTWETKPNSRPDRGRAPRRNASSPKSCVQCDGRMSIWPDLDAIHVYSLQDDEWSTLTPPPQQASGEGFIRGLGHWQSQLYAVSKNEQATLSVWKLDIDGPAQKWSEFERMPIQYFTWLLQRDHRLPIVTSHCNEYLLMHVLTVLSDSGIPRKRGRRMRGRRYVLLNISTKRWEIVDLPNEELYHGY